MKKSWIKNFFFKSERSILNKVAFLGGKSHFPSVRVRCVEIAKATGCDYITEVTSVDDIPGSKEIFVCVKPLFKKEMLEDLQKRGTVIWDVHDNYCPRNFIDHYLVSSKGAYQKFRSYGSIHKIPHHHCNFSGFPNLYKTERKPIWIGSSEWIPNDLSGNVDIYDGKQMTGQEIINLYKEASILLNIRAQISVTSESASEHIRINPGIKLINSIGFAVPSISNREPAYFEIGPECTIFVNTTDECLHWISRLQKDDTLYNILRNNCIFKASKYSLPNIAKQYLDLFVSKV